MSNRRALTRGNLDYTTAQISSISQKSAAGEIALTSSAKILLKGGHAGSRRRFELVITSQPDPHEMRVLQEALPVHLHPLLPQQAEAPIHPITLADEQAMEQESLARVRLAWGVSQPADRLVLSRPETYRGRLQA